MLADPKPILFVPSMGLPLPPRSSWPPQPPPVPMIWGIKTMAARRGISDNIIFALLHCGQIPGAGRRGKDWYAPEASIDGLDISSFPKLKQKPPQTGLFIQGLRNIAAQRGTDIHTTRQALLAGHIHGARRVSNQWSAPASSLDARRPEQPRPQLTPTSDDSPAFCVAMKLAPAEPSELEIIATARTLGFGAQLSGTFLDDVRRFIGIFRKA